METAMRNKKVFEYLGLKLRSKEELEFLYWLEEAKANGFVQHYVYEPITFDLAPSKWDGTRHLLNKQIYTPDFYIQFLEPINTFDHDLYLIDNAGFVDIKGVYGRGFTNSSAYTFPIVQKWLYDKCNIYVNKIVARDYKTKKGFFTKTWAPQEVAFAKNRIAVTRNKSFENCKLIDEVKDALRLFE